MLNEAVEGLSVSDLRGSDDDELVQSEWRGVLQG